MGVITRTANVVLDMFVHVMFVFLLFIVLSAAANIFADFAPAVTLYIAYKIITMSPTDPYTSLFLVSCIITTVLKLMSTYHKEK